MKFLPLCCVHLVCYISLQKVPCFCLFQPAYFVLLCSWLDRLASCYTAFSAFTLHYISSYSPFVVWVSVNISPFSFFLFFLSLDAKYGRQEIAFWKTIVASRYVLINSFTCLSLKDWSTYESISLKQCLYCIWSCKQRD